MEEGVAASLGSSGELLPYWCFDGEPSTLPEGSLVTPQANTPIFNLRPFFVNELICSFQLLDHSDGDFIDC